MKKLLFVLAIVAVYGLSVTTAKASVVIAEKAKVSIVASDNAPEGEKVKKTVKKAETPCTSKEEAKSGCSEKQKAECAGKAKSCCGSKETAPVPTPKK